MAKPASDKRKRVVPEAGHGTGLTHHPFDELRAMSAPNGAATELHVGVASAPARERATAHGTRGRLVLRREKKHRGGKTVVVITGLRANAHLAESESAALLQDLKRELGCGGAVEVVAGDTHLVLQGDQPARVAERLRAHGFRVDGVTS